MQKLMITLLEASISMSLIALIYIVLTPLLSRKITAKGRYYTWLIIVIGLIIPFRFYPGASVIYMDKFIPTLKAGGNQVKISTVSQGDFPLATIQWTTIFFVIWVLGVLAFIIYHTVRHGIFLKMIKRWSTKVIDPTTKSILRSSQEDLQVRQQVSLRICPGISSPMILGFMKPVILIPPGSIPEDELAFIFKHELVHFKRKDPWYKMLVFLAVALHWFNPLVYMIAREISLQCEMSCDEEVIKNTDLACRQKYVETIIGVIRNKSSIHSQFSTNFYSSKQSMKDRVFSIMDVRVKQKGITIAAVVIAATIYTGMVLKVSTPVSADITGNFDEELGSTGQMIEDNKTIRSTDQTENTSIPTLIEDIDDPKLEHESSEMPMLMEEAGKDTITRGILK